MSQQLNMKLIDWPLLLGDDLNAKVQFNCALKTIATVQKLGNFVSLLKRYKYMQRIYLFTKIQLHLL